MKFNEIFEKLEQGEYVTRENLWNDGNKYIQRISNELNLIEAGTIPFGKRYELTNEDLFAEDWRTVTEEEITIFRISEANLKELGASDELIEKIKTKLNYAPLLSNQLIPISENHLIGKLKIQDLKSLGISTDLNKILPSFTEPEIIKKFNK